MAVSKTIRDQLVARIEQRPMYNRMDKVRRISANSITSETALYVVASQEGIPVPKILKRENKLEALKEFQDAASKFDFNGQGTLRKRAPSMVQEKDERSPYDIPLARYGLDEELVRDCKVQPPYRKAVSEALLTLETRIREKLGLPDDCIGIALIDEAQKRDIFKRSVQSEALGLAMLYRGAIMWLRNPAGHRKIEYSKEDALKIVLFSDYLVKLFEELV